MHSSALKVLDATGAGLTSDVIDAIDFAVANRRLLDIDVINLSLGHPDLTSRPRPIRSCRRSSTRWPAGIVVVTSAGNFGGDPETHTPGYAGITSPGNAPSAITVGALDTNQTGARDDDTVAAVQLARADVVRRIRRSPTSWRPARGWSPT